MKHGKNPTVKQRIFLKSRRLNPDNWLVCKNTDKEMIIEHRHTNATRTIVKG